MKCPEDATIGIRELRQHASQYVAMAANGQHIVVTNHGRPAARLVPVEAPAADGLEHLVAAGELLPPSEPGNILDLPIVKASPQAPSSQRILDDIREDRL